MCWPFCWTKHIDGKPEMLQLRWFNYWRLPLAVTVLIVSTAITTQVSVSNRNGRILWLIFLKFKYWYYWQRVDGFIHPLSARSLFAALLWRPCVRPTSSSWAKAIVWWLRIDTIPHRDTMRRWDFLKRGRRSRSQYVRSAPIRRMIWCRCCWGKAPVIWSSSPIRSVSRWRCMNTIAPPKCRRHRPISRVSWFCFVTKTEFWGSCIRATARFYRWRSLIMPIARTLPTDPRRRCPSYQSMESDRLFWPFSPSMGPLPSSSSKRRSLICTLFLSAVCIISIGFGAEIGSESRERHRDTNHTMLTTTRTHKGFLSENAVCNLHFVIMDDPDIISYAKERH